MITTNAGSGSSTSTTITITRQTTIADEDSDGISDSWELTHFGTTTGAIAGADPDGDMSSNLEEYYADTDPGDSNSVCPKVVEVLTTGSSVMTLSAGSPTTNSRVYDVWVATNLVNPAWTPRYLNVPGAINGGPITLVVTNIGDLGYYRAGVRMP